MDDNTYKLAIAVVNSAPALIGGIAAIAASYFSWRSHVTSKVTQELTKKVELNTNGMKEELVSATKSAAFDAGKLSMMEGLTNEKNR